VSDEEQPSLRLTFVNVALPLFQHVLSDELVSEGLVVVPGPAPIEERGGGREVVEVVRVTLEVLGAVDVVAGAATLVARIVRAIEAAVRKGKQMPETEVVIYGPDNEVLRVVRIPAKRDT